MDELTADLRLRCGLHSGPVTAGVLRGDRARFQLFGDTVNTGKQWGEDVKRENTLMLGGVLTSFVCGLSVASRMESTGVLGKIQVSQRTADLLVAAGKPHWVKPREDTVLAKGKGVLQTFWLNLVDSRATCSTASSQGDYSTDSFNNLGGKVKDRSRLEDWMTELLLESMKKLVRRPEPRIVASGPTTKRKLMSFPFPSPFLWLGLFVFRSSSVKRKESTPLANQLYIAHQMDLDVWTK